MATQNTRSQPLARHIPKIRQSFAASCSALFLLAGLARAQVVTITTDTTIGPTDTTISGVPLASADITVQSTATLTMSGRHAIRRLTLNGGTLTHPPAAIHTYAPNDTVRGLDLTIATNLTLAANGLIDVSGRGYAPGRGVAPGLSTNRGGGSHAGEGSSSDFVPNQTYGDLFAPDEFGSGGWASLSFPQSCINNPATPGRGGGRIKLTIASDLIQNGIIRANGVAYGTCSSLQVGGGAGGSIFISCREHTGTGGIFANGGAGRDDFDGRDGAGGGGRITIESSLNTFTGTVRASGGCTNITCTAQAGAGTVVKQNTNTNLTQLIVENTAFVTSYATPLTDLNIDTVVIDKARAKLIGPAIMGELRMENAAFLTPEQLVPLHLTILGDLRINGNSRISATGLGHPGGQGPSAGNGAFPNSTSPSGGGGGGNDGRGGNGSGGGVGGLGTSRDRFMPDIPGSGGGPARATGTGTSFTPGGAGGGVIHLEVGGNVFLGGYIEANGLPGFSASQSPDGCTLCSSSNRGSGGGAGGSIYMKVAGFIEPIFSEPFPQRIAVNGASSDGLSCPSAQRAASGCGGGGAGGTLALYNCGNTPPNWVVANGGAARSSATSGGTGTVRGGSGKITITTPPAPLTTYAGSSAQLSVAATSTQSGTLTYQWYRGTQPLSNNTRIQGATSPILTILNSTCQDSANYRVIITDSCGQFPSEFVQLTVLSVADFNQDGGVDGADVESFFTLWEAGDPTADVNQDGGTDGADVEPFFLAWSSGGDC